MTLPHLMPPRPPKSEHSRTPNETESPDNDVIRPFSFSFDKHIEVVFLTVSSSGITLLLTLVRFNVAQVTTVSDCVFLLLS